MQKLLVDPTAYRRKSAIKRVDLATHLEWSCVKLVERAAGSRVIIGGSMSDTKPIDRYGF